MKYKCLQNFSTPKFLTTRVIMEFFVDVEFAILSSYMGPKFIMRKFKYFLLRNTQVKYVIEFLEGLDVKFKLM